MAPAPGQSRRGRPVAGGDRCGHPSLAVVSGEVAHGALRLAQLRLGLGSASAASAPGGPVPRSRQASRPARLAPGPPGSRLQGGPFRARRASACARSSHGAPGRPSSAAARRAASPLLRFGSPAVRRPAPSARAGGRARAGPRSGTGAPPAAICRARCGEARARAGPRGPLARIVLERRRVQSLGDPVDDRRAELLSLLAQKPPCRPNQRVDRGSLATTAARSDWRRRARPARRPALRAARRPASSNSPNARFCVLTS